MNRKELTEMIAKLTKKMKSGSGRKLNFEEAAELRDELKKYKIALRDYKDIERIQYNEQKKEYIY